MVVKARSDVMGDLSKPATRFYGASGVRKTFYALVFLVLLPFFISLPVMLYQRFAQGVWLETWGLIVIAVAFAIIMALILFELLNSILARIEIGQTGVRLVLPYRRALLPTVFYRKREIPYSQMHVIETRREVYGGLWAPVMMYGGRIIDKDGVAYSLGYVSEADVDPLFPIKDIVEDIARRAGIEVVDKGCVRRRLTKKIMGVSATGEEDVAEAQIGELNQGHKRFMYSLIAILLVLLVLGVGVDFMSSDIDRGERARDAVVRSADPSGPRGTR